VIWGVLVLVALASHRLTHLVTSDSITARWRERMLWRYPPTVEPMLDGAGDDIPGSARQVPHPVIVFIHCDWCVSVWVSAGVLVVTHFLGLLDSWQLAALAWLGVSSVVGFLSRLGA
jgi:Protein of unknown function (DUF1360)